MFQISSLQRAQFEELLALDDASLAARGAKRCIADRKPGFPCRVSLEDAEPGERVVLVPFWHQPADSPYRASGPIFIRELARTAAIAPGEVPPLFRTRLMSIRAYDADDLMIDADVVEGRELEQTLSRVLENPQVSYAHLHYARPGCYAGRVARA